MSYVTFYRKSNNLTLENCTLEGNNSEGHNFYNDKVDAGYFRAVYVADDGYIFDENIKQNINILFNGKIDNNFSVTFSTYDNQPSLTITYPTDEFTLKDSPNYAYINGTIAATKAETGYSSADVVTTNDISNTSLDNNLTLAEKGNTYNFQITANKHYQINTAKITIKNSLGNVIYESENTNGSFTWKVDELDDNKITITFTGSCDIVSADVNATNNIDNSNMTMTPVISLNEKANFSVKPFDGYTLETSTITLYDENNNSFFTKTDNTGDLSFTLDSLPTTSINAIITGSTKAITFDDVPIEYNLTQLQNFTLEPQPTTVNRNNVTAFNINLNDGFYYQFNPKFTLTEYKSTGNPVALYDNVDATKVDNLHWTFNIDGKLFDEFANKLNLRVIGKGKQNNFKLDVDDQLKNIDLSPTPKNTISNHAHYKYTFTAIENYEIVSIPAIRLFASQHGDIVEVQATTNDDVTYIAEFDLNGDFNDDEEFLIHFTGEAVKETDISRVYPLLEVHSLTRQQLIDLQNTRFIKIETSGTGENPTISASDIDLSNYIIGLFSVYLPVSISDSTSTIKLGVYDTEINAHLIEQRFIYGETDKLLIKGFYNNSLDYNSNVTVYIPFYGYDDVEPTKIINREIQLKYQIEIINGEGFVELWSDDNLLKSYPITSKLEFPWNKTTSDSINISNSIKQSYYVDLIPKILIETNKTFSTDFNTINNTDEFVLLNTINGYCKGDIYNLIIDENYITQNEIDSIRNLITQGVVL